MSGKVQEAEECLLRADKYLKTSMFKWKPDYDEAANEYQKAATLYKNAKNNQKALEMNLKAAEYFQESKSFFAAAKVYEQAALIYGKEMNNIEEAVALFEKAAFMYREHGVPDTAGLSLDRGAKMVESRNPVKAAEFYSQACDVSMIENKPAKAAEYAGKSARIYLKLKNFERALEMADKQLVHVVDGGDERIAGRVVIYKVLIQLATDDFVAAKKSWLEAGGYCESQESCILNALLTAFDVMDKKQIFELLNHSYMKTIDNEYAKLARDLALRYEPPKETPSSRHEQPEATSEDEMAAMM
ncbi:Gamma-soluble NSF attachment protein [Halotydeus destructor]|nr:Gamma-soluble NSF attachment protein [Halotydeus destructor]